MSSTYIDFGIENNDKDHKFKVGDPARISKHENIFPKGYVPYCSEEIQLLKKLIRPQTQLIEGLNGEEMVRTFYEKELQRNKSD